MWYNQRKTAEQHSEEADAENILHLLKYPLYISSFSQGHHDIIKILHFNQQKTLDQNIDAIREKQRKPSNLESPWLWTFPHYGKNNEIVKNTKTINDKNH